MGTQTAGICTSCWTLGVLHTSQGGDELPIHPWRQEPCGTEGGALWGFCVWCDLSGVEGEIGESLLRFQDQGCAGFGRGWVVLAGGLEWEVMDPKSFRTVGNCTSQRTPLAWTFGSELMSFPDFNCFSGLAWTVQCPFFIPGERVWVLIPEQNKPRELCRTRGCSWALSSAGGRHREWRGGFCAIPAAGEKSWFLKTICALALRDLGSHKRSQLRQPDVY